MIVSRKRAFVTLAVAATLASCGEAREDGLKQQMQRDVYKSKADCEKDWKGKSALCEKIPEQQTQQSASSTGYRTHTPYVGGGSFPLIPNQQAGRTCPCKRRIAGRFRGIRWSRRRWLISTSKKGFGL